MPDKKTLDYYVAELRRIEESRQADTEKQVKKIYKEILQDLNSFLGNEYASYSDGDGILSVAVLQEKARYAKFLQEVDQHLKDVTPGISKTIKATVQDTYKSVYTGMIDAVQKSADNEELTEKLKGLSLRPEVMKRAIENPISGLTLPDTLEKHRQEVIYGIKQQINIGLMTGERFDTMAKNVNKVISGDNGTGGLYGKAVNIVRTEVHRVQESGMMDCAEDILPSLEGSGLIYAAIWRNMGDGKVRPSYRVHTPKGWKTKIAKTTANHQKMEGVTIRVGDKFELEPGVFAKCPGSSGTARNDCRCRCFLEYELMTPDEFAKATNKSVDEVKKQFGIVDKPKKEYLTKKKLQENINNADVELESLLKKFEFSSGGFTYKEIKEKYPEGLSNFAMGKKLNILTDIQSKIENIETQKSDWQAKLDKKLITEKKKTLTKEQIKLQEQLDNFEIKTYSGIWKNDVTTADWPNLNIEGKKKYYEGKFITETDPDKMKEFQDLYNQVKELDIKGKEYYDIKSQINKVKQDLTNLKNSSSVSKTNPFTPDAYGQRKIDAIKNRFKNNSDADAYYRPQLDRDFLGLEDSKKYATWEYTHNSNPMNKPLSGYTDTFSRSDFRGLGNVPWNRENNWRSIPSNFSKYGSNGHVVYENVISNLTKAIEQTTFDKDVLTVRGSGDGGLAGLVESGGLDFNIVMGKLQNQDINWLKNNLEGQIFQNHSFTSTAMVNVPTPFAGNIYYEIYMPKGTKALYAEPQSYFGNTINGAELYIGQKANGISNEAEIIIQRGTKFKITEIDIKSDSHSGHSNTYTVKMQVAEQPDYFKTGYEHTFDDGLTSEK